MLQTESKSYLFYKPVPDPDLQTGSESKFWKEFESFYEPIANLSSYKPNPEVFISRIKIYYIF